VVLGASAADGSTVHPALSGLVPIVPTSGRAFGKGSEVTAYFQVQQGSKAPLAPVLLRIRILDDQGAVRLDRQETLEPGRFSALRTTEHSLRLPMETLGPGWHLLSVEARLGERIAPARDVMFEVR
jgi:hypothetical protein